MRNKIAATVGILLGAFLITFALTQYIAKDEKKITPTKVDAFAVELSGVSGTPGLSPGDSIDVSPKVTNSSTVPAYLFIKVRQATSTPIYTYTVGDDWVEVASTGGTKVFAYVEGTEMAKVEPDGETSALTDRFTLSCSNATFANLSDGDLKVEVIGYGVGTEGVSAVPSECWTQAKEISEGKDDGD